jgi:hypothetical protein
MERKTDEEFLEDMASQIDDLIGKMMLISDTYSIPKSKASIGKIFEGNFEMTLIGGDVVHPRAIQIDNPPYRLGEMGHYFHFRIDKPGKRKIEWGDFEWYTSSPECFTQLKNGNRILRVKMHKDSTEYILENVGKEVKESENVA